MTLKEIIPAHCPEEFSDCEVVYDNDWSDYEENGWVIVFKFFDELMSWEYQSSIFAEDNNVYFDPQPISEIQLAEIKKIWENIHGEYIGI